METSVNVYDRLSEVQNSVSAITSNRSSSCRIPQPFVAPISTSRNHGVSSTSYLTAHGDDYTTKLIHYQKNYVINQMHSYLESNIAQHDGLPLRLYYKYGGKSGYTNNHYENGEAYFGKKNFCAIETCDNSTNCDSGSSVFEHGGPSEVNFSSSPQSFYSATFHSEAARSSSHNTENSEGFNQSCDIGGVNDLCYYNESSMKSMSSVSDITDSSSYSTISSPLCRPRKVNDARWEAIQAIRERDQILEMRHFRVLRTLGCGDIGKVRLAELSDTGLYFAMKFMNKQELESRKKLVRVRTEREILQSLDHPFLPTLYAHFETDAFSCLVMEFCPGGDLHVLRQRQPGRYFSEHAARFYAAEVLLALEYLHMLGIIYRDLKPENVLVREDGHIMLSDFDLSLRCPVNPIVESSNPSKKTSRYCSTPPPASFKPNCVMKPSCLQSACFTTRKVSRKIKNHRKLLNTRIEIPPPHQHHKVTSLPELIAEPTNTRSMSFVGTHEYLAPEIIKGEGHGSAVDWWTFGIFLYELLFGRTPFKGAADRATLLNVVGQPLRFPESPSVSFAARDLIRGLLVKEPKHRLAYRRGASEIKQHPFFQDVNWALIRCTVPPEVPRQVIVKNVAGTSALKPPPGSYLDFDYF